MKHLCNSQLANIQEMAHSTPEMNNKQEQKQIQPKYHKPIKKLKRPRVRVKTQDYIPVTSSDRHIAFMINEWRINHLDKYTEKRRPYYRVFGQEKFISEDEVELFKAHGVTIYYK